ncbi:MAG: hypothetical protein WC382_03335 [Methanoregulaceae archaeon]
MSVPTHPPLYRTVGQASSPSPLILRGRLLLSFKEEALIRILPFGDGK